ncbi:NAD(P)-dependent oxidoreductase [Clostridium taeniosporum]|uniref:precorrin-2 dehydrogenase n=1 Tax=Clostridium taeniosporum TaxID=394958 RepID=A0A1D7XLV8_9CLOT|nr:NAD(P)-dependent oxidoreductase [Clostridium taeniosporum]AOR24247.1 precorrin-2 dehydrogenase [Clostridium taeniosporum]
MFKNNKEYIHDPKLNYSFISLLSNKINVGVIGGGRAGFIKIKHFLNTGCYIEVISKDFCEEVINLSKEFKEKLTLIKGEFNYEFLLNKHLILITIDDKRINDNIKGYCNKNFKIYIESSNFQDGMGVVPVQRKLNNITFAINTNGGNPKGAVMLANKVQELLKDYDDFIKLTTNIRNKAKKLSKYKKEIIDFISCDDFKFFYDNNKETLILRLYFDEEILKELGI